MRVVVAARRVRWACDGSRPPVVGRPNNIGSLLLHFTGSDPAYRLLSTSLGLGCEEKNQKHLLHKLASCAASVAARSELPKHARSNLGGQRQRQSPALAQLGSICIR